MKWLIVLAALVTGAMLAVGLSVLVLAARSQTQDQQVSRFTVWEQCELNSNGWGGAGDPCGPMPQP